MGNDGLSRLSAFGPVNFNALLTGLILDFFASRLKK